MPTSRRPPKTRIPKKIKGGFQNRESTTYQCAACNVLCDCQVSFLQHLETELHTQNYALLMFEKHRKRKVKDRHGIVVRTKCQGDWLEANKEGTLKKQVPPGEATISYKFELQNRGTSPIVLNSVSLLHPYPCFSISDDLGVSARKSAVRILPDFCYNVEIHFTNKGRGSYGVPVALSFIRMKDNEEKYFDIIRVIVVKVQGVEYPSLEPEDSDPSPFRGDPWNNVNFVVPGCKGTGKPLKQQTAFEIPEVFEGVLSHWLAPWDGMSREQMRIISDILNVAIQGYEKLESYYDFLLHSLLYLDEFDGLDQVSRYNMRGVSLRVLPNFSRLELKVPGLAEKRPSLMVHDLIYCRVRYPDGTTEEVEYEGQITEVQDKCVVLNYFAPEFMKRVAEEKPLVDVRFSFSRYPISVMHTAVHNVVQNNLKQVVFPSCREPLPSLLRKRSEDLEFFNKEIEGNPEQKEAVINILKSTCRPAPYIIFGPPGTGKTVTVVEAILQVKKVFPNSYILVCAPSNAACDLVACKLAKFLKITELLRMHSSTREWKTVPKALHNYSNRDENTYFMPLEKELKKYRVVVCTLIAANRLLRRESEEERFYERRVHFTHIFIDECGQALEPEALVPLGVALGPVSAGNPSGVVVLAGDPCQLGPICNSHRAENLGKELLENAEEGHSGNDIQELNKRMGLGVSLLERLMVTCPLYQKDSSGCYKSQYITKLLCNFRSHPSILHLPNKLFYSGELIAACPDTIRQDYVCRKILQSNGKPAKDCAVIFHGVLGQEKREGRSPSYFNRYEADQVLHYVNKLLSPSKGIEVKPSDIGIISPYIRQVYKLKHALEERNWGDVEVGTTETFQGREKRVVIISTVRANRNLLDFDHRFRLGFVANPKRFNVAVTRAQSLLVVVGNPYQLIRDENWQELIAYCQVLGSYQGSAFKPRNQEWWDHVVGTIEKLSERD